MSGTGKQTLQQHGQKQKNTNRQSRNQQVNARNRQPNSNRNLEKKKRMVVRISSLANEKYYTKRINIDSESNVADLLLRWSCGHKCARLKNTVLYTSEGEPIAPGLKVNSLNDSTFYIQPFELRKNHLLVTEDKFSVPFVYERKCPSVTLLDGSVPEKDNYENWPHFQAVNCTFLFSLREKKTVSILVNNCVECLDYHPSILTINSATMTWNGECKKEFDIPYKIVQVRHLSIHENDLFQLLKWILVGLFGFLQEKMKKGVGLYDVYDSLKHPRALNFETICMFALTYLGWLCNSSQIIVAGFTINLQKKCATKMPIITGGVGRKGVEKWDVLKIVNNPTKNQEARLRSYCESYGVSFPS